MTKYLGELDDDDLVMFVVEHLKDHKGPQKLVEGVEPVGYYDYHLAIVLIHQFSGPGGRGRGVCDQSLEASNLREHGLRGGVTHREDDGGVMRGCAYSQVRSVRARFRLHFPQYIKTILRRFPRGQILLPWSRCKESITIFCTGCYVS